MTEVTDSLRGGEVESPLGPVAAMFVGGRLVRLGFGRCQALPRAERRLVNRLAGDLASYFAGKPRRWETSLDLSGGTAFQRRVWRELAKVPFGATVSYGELARRVGRPGAARAVGQAVGANPIPILIPCHRVICSDGGLGGFSAGLEIKRWLLAHEGCL